jgi:TRAP-type C4-dicarboxylate transport system substrate-binding protein
MNSKRAIGRGTLGVVALAAMLGFMPPAVHSADEPLILKVAIMVPRSGEAATQAAIYNRRLGELTNNTVGLRIYWGAAAGQDREVLRKMRAGQIDGSPFPLEIISTFVRQALVLGSPALFNNYRQVDAARAALTPQMDQEADPQDQ